MTEKPKTVLLLIARFEFGGIPIQAFLWSNFLKLNGFHPIVLAQYTYDSKYIELLKKSNIGYGFLNTSDFNGSKKESLFYFYNLINCLQSYKPDYIFPFNKHLSFHVNLIWRFTTAKKCFFMERGHGIDELYSWKDLIVKNLSQINSSVLIYNSYSAYLKSRFPNKSIVIKNTFREVKRFTTDFIFPVEFSENDIVFIHIANLGIPKNYQLLIDGWKIISLKNPNFKLLVIGSDIKGNNNYLKQSFLELGIFYLGRKENVYPFIDRADICLLSSYNEGCPNVILEYMNAGKLIVASNIDSIREVLDPMNHQYLFDNQSPNDFANKVLSLYYLSLADKINLIAKNKEKLQKDYSESNFKLVLNLFNG